MSRDIKTLTPADVPGLSGRELDAAVEWFVHGDDLIQSGYARSDPTKTMRTWHKNTRPFTADANRCLAFWEPGGALCDVAGADIIRSLIDVLRTQGVKAFLEAACRAAVLEAMRRKGT